MKTSSAWRTRLPEGIYPSRRTRTPKPNELEPGVAPFQSPPTEPILSSPEDRGFREYYLPAATLVFLR